MHELLIASLLHIIKPQAPPPAPNYHLEARGPQWVRNHQHEINAAIIAARKASKSRIERPTADDYLEARRRAAKRRKEMI